MSLITSLSKVKPRYALFGIVLLVAAIRRFSLPSVPFADGDIFGYFLPAVRLAEDGTLFHQGTRSFVYPMFIAGLMKLSGSVTIIPIVQHLLGLFTGFLIFRIFEQPLFTNLKSSKLDTVIVVMQLCCSSFFLLASSIWQYEHFITSQSMFTLLLVAQLLFLVKMVGKTEGEKSNLRYGSAIVFLALLTFILTPRMGFALPLMGLIVLAEFYRHCIPLKKWIAPILLPTVIFVATIWLPEQYLARKYDTYTFDFPFKQFFYAHADMAKTLIQRDIANNQTKVSTPILQQVDSILTLPMAPHQNFKYLGFDVDTMLIGGYDRNIDTLLTTNGYNTIDFQKSYDERILKELPITYALKIADQTQHYYFGADGYDRLHVTEFAELYNVRDMSLEMTQKPEMDDWQLSRQLKSLSAEQLNDWQWSSNFVFIIPFSLIDKHFYMHLLLVFGLLYLYNRVRKKQLPNGYKELYRYALYLILIQLALVLTVAVIHTFDYHRYAVWFFSVELILLGIAIIGIATNIKIIRDKK
jgi:hypothetical protein